MSTAQSVVVSANPVSWTPHVLDGKVKAVVQVGNRIIVGGYFSKVEENDRVTQHDRANLFAFDATTGAIDPNFAPALNNGVEALAAAPDDTSVFVGGAFATVNGAASRGLAELDTATGLAVPAFKSSTNGIVRDLTVRAGKLYAGGTFSKLKNVPRTLLGAVDVTTGDVDPNLNVSFTTPRAGVLAIHKLDVTPDGSRLIATGTFTIVGGLDRYQIAVLDLSTTPASVANWQTNRFKDVCNQAFDTYLRDIDIDPTGSWFAVATTGAYRRGLMCDSASRWELSQTGSGLLPTWVDYTGGDTLWSIAVTGTAVYIGGHERWANNPFASNAAGPGAVPREGIGALDPLNGLPLSWNPSRDRGVGAFALYPTSQGLWVGSDTDRLALEYHAKIGMFPVTGGETIPPAQPGTLPGTLYSANTNSTLVSRTFTGAVFGPASTVGGTGVDWAHTRGAFMLSGKLYTGWDNGSLYVRAFDGTTVGTATALNLYGLTNTNFPIATTTGMTFDPSNGRLYYTVSGDARLYYRYFTAESGVVGAETFIASGTGDGLSWNNTTGITLAGGNLYYGSSNGNLSRITFSAGRPVPGTALTISGPGIDGNNWSTSRGLLLLST